MDYNKINNLSVGGKENIVLQDITGGNITINIGGKEKTLETAMNQWLVLTVMPKIAMYDPLAQKFIAAVQNTENWEQQLKFRNAALIILQSSYIGVVGIFMKKLSAIGNLGFSAEKLKENIRNSYFLSLRLLDLSNILLISALWDSAERTKITLNENDKKIISQFFEQNVERDIGFSFLLFKALYRSVVENKIAFPLKEMEELKPENNPTLAVAFAEIEEVFSNTTNRQTNGEDCFRVENSLADLLCEFSFMVKYKIQAVKGVNYHHIRSLEEYFIHKLSFYGLSSKQTEQGNLTSENINFANKGINTDSVIVYQKDYFNGINLFPFLIDYNNVLLEEGTNLCVFSHKDLSDETMLNYISIADNDFIGIQTENTSIENDLNKIFSNKENIIQHKKNTLLKLISNVKKAILGKEEETAEDFLDKLFD